MAYIDVVTGIPGLTHYYPLNSDYGGEDAWGSTTTNPSAKGTNFKHLTNQGGVTFGAAGATFNGAANSWLRAATDRGFSVDNGLALSANAISIVVCVTFPTYDQGGQNHWIGKGYENGSNTLEWALRLYGEPGTQGRTRGTSNYYWNPNPGLHADGAVNSGRLGSGAYMAPPEGGRTPFNSPVNSGATNVEHMFVLQFTKGSSDGSTGRCIWNYGSVQHAFAVCSNRGMWDDARINPRYTTGDLSIGKRMDTSWTVRATMRRIAFFNRLITISEMNQLRTARITFGNTEGTLSGGGSGGDPGTPGSVAGITVGTAVANTGTGGSASSLAVAAPAITATQVHCIATTVNATTPTITTPTGYTVVAATEHGGTTNTQTHLLRRSGPAAAGTVTITPGTSVARISAVPFILTGADVAAPIEASGTAESLVAPSLTAVDSRLLVTVYGYRTAIAGVAPAATPNFTPPTGMTELAEVGSVLTGSTQQVATSLNALTLGAAGATGAKTVTTNATGGAGGAISFLVEPAAVPVVAKIGTLQDNFASFDASKWVRSSATLVTVAANELTINPTVDTPNVQTVDTLPFDLTDSSVSVKMVRANANNTSAQFLVRNIAVGTDTMGFRLVVSGTGVATLFMGRRDAASSADNSVNGGFVAGSVLSVAYSATNHAFLRIRRAATGNVFFEAAPAGTGPWTPLHDIITQSWLNNVRVYFTAALAAAGTATTQRTRFSAINNTPTDAVEPEPDVFKIETLQDDFTTKSTARWTFAGADVISGEARVEALNVAPNNRLTSVNNYDMTNSVFEVDVIPATGGTSPTTYIVIDQSPAGSPQQDFALLITGTASGPGTATISFRSGGTSSAPLTWAWQPRTRMRFRHGTALGGTAGRFYVESGQWNEATQQWGWTARAGATGLVAPLWMESVKVRMGAFSSDGTSSDGIFDNFNTPSIPVTVVSGDPITDSFESLTVDSAKWTAVGTPTLSSGVLSLDAVAGSGDALVSKTKIDLTADRQYVDVIEVPTAAGAYGVFRLERDASNALQWYFEGGLCKAERIINGTLTSLGSVAHSLANTRYLQIREAAGRVYFEYGPSPQGMTSLADIALPFTVTALSVRVQGGAE
jgi:hypothetical protein